MGAPPDLSSYPDQPGIYLYRDAKGKILYVGKARSIRKRLASYFAAGPKHPKTEALLAEFETIDTVVANTESEALALENAFIKKHKPRYNILLRDDKTYPYIKVTTGEEWPRALRDAARPEGRAQLLRAVPAGADLPRRDEDGAADVPDPHLPDRDRRQAAASLPLLRHARLPRAVRGVASRRRPPTTTPSATSSSSSPGATTSWRRGSGRRWRPPPEAESFEMAAAYRDCLRTVEELAQKQRVQSLAGRGRRRLRRLRRRRKPRRVGPPREGRLGPRYAGVLLGGDRGRRPGRVLGGAPLAVLRRDRRSFRGRSTSPTRCPRRRSRPSRRGSRSAAARGSRCGRRRGGPRSTACGSRATTPGRATCGASGRSARLGRRRRSPSRRPSTSTRGPPRIECFDISHLQGSETYASCVVFVDGKPAKGEYRAFRIDRARAGRLRVDRRGRHPALRAAPGATESRFPTSS